MAKIHEEHLIIKLSKLVKQSTEINKPLANEDMLSALEQVAQELAESGVLVEIERVTE